MALQDPGTTKLTDWAVRFALWLLRCAIASLAVAETGLTLARYDVIAKLAGFTAPLVGDLVALVALVLGFPISVSMTMWFS